MTDEAILEQLGERLAKRQIRLDLTQADLARQAGVGRSTVERMEAGHSTQMVSFVRVLRVLELLSPFMDAVPEPGLSPMQLIRNRHKVRQRASRKRDSPDEIAADWTWDDET